MLRKRVLFLSFSLICLSLFSQKEYHKAYFKNGQLKEEGWLFNDEKIAYWKFYYQNGTLKKEGHFKDNLETKY